MDEIQLQEEPNDALQIASLQRELAQARQEYIAAKARYEEALLYEPLFRNVNQ